MSRARTKQRSVSMHGEETMRRELDRPEGPMSGNLIHVINKLQKFATDKNIYALVNFPQIVTVGEQSAGKSSLLEMMMRQVNIFPVGTDIKTRLPAILKLIHTTSPRKYFTFDHIHVDPSNKESPLEEIEDFSRIAKIIDETTEHRLKEEKLSEKDVLNQPITICFYSCDVVTLTLVDLPGLTRNAAEGQNEDIVATIEAMTKFYIKNKNSLILAVSPATSDLVGSQSLAIAREFDPKGKRTIGVLTKIDLMDEGTDCARALRNEVMPLKLGWVGVVNRSFRARENNQTLDDALIHEHDFFESREPYREIADMQGSIRLSKLLNNVLNKHIEQVIPDIKRDLEVRLKDVNIQVQQYKASGRSSGHLDPHAALEQVLQRFILSIRSVSEGSGCSRKRRYSSGRSDGHIPAKKIKDVFEDDLPNLINAANEDENYDILSKEIREGVATHCPLGPNVFPPDQIVVEATESRIERTRAPCHEIVDKVFTIFGTYVISCRSVFAVYPELDTFVDEFLATNLEAQRQKCLDMVNEYIDQDKSYVTKSYTIFDKGSKPVGRELVCGSVKVRCYTAIEVEPAVNEAFYAKLYEDSVAFYQIDSDGGISEESCLVIQFGDGSEKSLEMHYGSQNRPMFLPQGTPNKSFTIKCLTDENKFPVELSDGSGPLSKIIIEPTSKIGDWFAAITKTVLFSPIAQNLDDSGVAEDDHCEPAQQSFEKKLQRVITDYMETQAKGCIYRIPKICMKDIVDEITDMIAGQKLRTEIYKYAFSDAIGGIENLMKESASEKKTRERAFAMQEFLETSLKELRGMKQ